MSETSDKKLGMSTRCVHAGDGLDAQGGIHAPLYNHSTFGFSSTQDVLDVVEGRSQRNLYTRYGLNPTIRSVEQKLADIEGGELSWVFSSGMAGESATFLAHWPMRKVSDAQGSCQCGQVAIYLRSNFKRLL